MSIKDQFGFLCGGQSFELEKFRIYPVPDYKKILGKIKKYAHRDGHIYPPIVHNVKLDEKTLKVIRKVSNSERPALLYRVPASHNIEIFGYVGEDGAVCRRDFSGFIVNLLSYMYETRLHFYDWWVDGRIPLERNTFIITQKRAEHFLNNAIDQFCAWDERRRCLFINILFMHARSLSYEWDWERFNIEYMVFDAIWRFSKETGRITGNVKHKDRLEKLCSLHGILFLKEEAERIVRLRNDLFHEVLWDGEQPCTAGGAGFAVSANLYRLNQRLIAAALKDDGEFIRTNWADIGRQYF